MARNYDEFIKSATSVMFGDSCELSRRDVIAEMERLMDNPLELYLRWFRYGKIIYIDMVEHFNNFIELLQGQDEIGPVTATVLNKQFDVEENNHSVMYFGKTHNTEGHDIYVLIYPYSPVVDNIAFQHLDTEYGVRAYALNMNKPNLSGLTTAFLEWNKDGYSIRLE